MRRGPVCVVAHTSRATFAGMFLACVRKRTDPQPSAFNNALSFVPACFALHDLILNRPGELS